VWNVFLVSEPGGFVHVGFGVAVIAAEVMVVPHVNKWDVAIESGLCGRCEDEIVAAAERHRDCFA
jgi:hypothetical protein